MNQSKKLAAFFTGAMLLSMMTASSAFAETRHRDETRSDEWRRNKSDREQSDWRTQSQNRHDGRAFDTSRSNDRRDRGTYRENQAYRDNRSYRDHESYRGQRGGAYDRAPVRNESRYYSGRVNRIEHWSGGFRVWVGGAPYPFFIAADRWARYPLRIGLNIRLGGYWDPIGYYNVYDIGPYAYATAGDIHGIVESVDYRRGTAVLRDDVSGSFVTVVLRGNDPRLGDLRPGDLVDLRGAWNRAGVFDAFNVDDLRPGGYRRNDRYDDERY